MIVYMHNNSGGKDWLTSEQWRTLERSGWVIRRTGRFPNLRPFEAVRHGLSYDDAVAEWEGLTGECPTVEGCPCCGNPHNFYDWKV